MQGNSSNAAVWSNGYVLIGPADAPIPQNGAVFDEAWESVGYLSGEDGFTKSTETDTEMHRAWGGHLIAVSAASYTITRQFTALESNARTYRLAYPGHSVEFATDGSGHYEGTINQPQLQDRFRVAFITRTGSAESGYTERRFVSAGYAMVTERGDVTETETDLQSRELTVTFFPASDEDSSGGIHYTLPGEESQFPLVYVWKGDPLAANGS